jgi:hypothetical protein
VVLRAGLVVTVSLTLGRGKVCKTFCVQRLRRKELRLLKPRAARIALRPSEIRVRVEIMGSQNFRIVGKSQPVLIMINPIIFTRTRTPTHPHRHVTSTTDMWQVTTRRGLALRPASTPPT